MIVGYMRVSTQKQNLATQKDLLIKHGVEKLYEEKASGRDTNRPILNDVIEYLRANDTLVIYDLSRLGRTVHQVMKLIEHFYENSIGFISIKENLDITTPVGKAMVSIIAAFNQMQVEIQNEKIKEGISNARINGKKLGRKRIGYEKIRLIQALKNDGYSNNDISMELKISKRTVINYLTDKKGNKNTTEKMI